MEAVGGQFGIGTSNETPLDTAPELHPALYESVQRRRTAAFLVDMVAVGVLVTVGSVFLAFLGLMTFGLGWGLFPALVPAAVLGYAAFGGALFSATPGMKLMGLTLRNWTGAPVDGLMAAFHSLLYWVSTALLTPFVLLFGLFNPRKRLLHDIVAGVMVLDARALARLASPVRPSPSPHPA